MMNRVLLLGLFVVLSFSLFGCTKKEQNNRPTNNISSGIVDDDTDLPKITQSMADVSNNKQFVLPPVRYDEKKIGWPVYAFNYTIESGAEELDFVGRIRIGDWLGEGFDGMVSYFDAEVTLQLKGKPLNHIVFIQDGGSYSFNSGYPLFQAGDELLIFGKIAPEGSTPYENAYWLPAGPGNLFYVLKNKSENVYYVDFNGASGSNVKEVQKITDSPALRSELRDSLVKMDSLLAEIVLQQNTMYIFRAGDIDEIIIRCVSQCE